MPHQDKNETITHAESLQRAFTWVFSWARWIEIKFRTNASWTPETLVAVASLIPCNDRENITTAYDDSRKIVDSWERGSSGKSYQGFFKQLIQHGQVLLAMAVGALRQKMLELLNRMEAEGAYQLFAVDGSRVELPRTKSNQERFCRKGHNYESQKKKAKQKGRKKTKSQQKKSDAPQAWITVLYHLALGLPWDFRTGPSGSSERDHLLQMIPSLPKNALVVADAGFVGYDYWAALTKAEIAFVIRVGANVTLLKQLGTFKQSGEFVYLWPDKQRKQGQPPLRLRLITLRDGDQFVHLVTNVLEQQELPPEQIIDIYRQRWHVELYYRTFKQTFGKRKLRCKSATNVEQELIWSVIGLWMITLYGISQQWEAGESLGSLSPAGVIQAFRESIRQWKVRPEPDEFLDTALQNALKDDYVRTSEKTNKEYPRKKKKRKIGAPTIQPATTEQRKQAKEIALALSL